MMSSLSTGLEIRDRLLALFMAIAPVSTLPGSTSTERFTANSGRVLAGRLPVGTTRTHCRASRLSGRLTIQGQFFVLESATPRAPLANRTAYWIFSRVSGMLPNLIWLLPLCGHWRDNFVMEPDEIIANFGSSWDPRSLLEPARSQRGSGLESCSWRTLRPDLSTFSGPTRSTLWGGS